MGNRDEHDQPDDRLVEPLATALGETIAATELFPLIAHELIQPLTAALGGAVSLRRKDLSYRSRDAVVELVVRNLNQIASLLGSFKTFSFAETDRLDVQLTSIELKKFLEQVAEDVGGARTYFIDCPSEMKVHADATLLRQLMSNLVLNARKFSTAGTEIGMRCTSGDDVVELVVTDQGSGLPDDPSRLFDRYVSGDSHRGGLGLGLYVAKRIVDAHGGRIWAHNRSEQGAEFHILLPA